MEKTDRPPDEGALRLQVRLARAGLASRRGCETFIARGRITVNGETVRRPGTRVLPGDDIRLDGRPVGEEAAKLYIALHKPPGFLCSEHDPFGRPLARNLLEPALSTRVFHVGRLDYMSSGLIFYTNDGPLARTLTHPSCMIEKEYQVTSKGAIPDNLITEFLRGITVKGVHYRALECRRLGPRGVRVVLTEGKNRELRRVFSAFRVGVKTIHRLRIASIRLNGIREGRFRRLRTDEIRSLENAARRRARDHRR